MIGMFGNMDLGSFLIVSDQCIALSQFIYSSLLLLIFNRCSNESCLMKFAENKS